MQKSWSDKTFVVTGGCSGIGLATVQQLLEHSSTVHVIDRQSELPKALLELQAKRLHFYPGTDVSSRQEVAATFKKIFATSPVIDGLVNSAGVSPASGELLDTDETFHSNISINLVGTWNVSSEILKRFQDEKKTHPDFQPYRSKAGVSGSCSIVNIGSTASVQGYSAMGAYVASKHAVLGLTRSWAIDFAQFGVRVNLVAPGITRTPLQAQFDSPSRGDVVNETLKKIPLARLAEPFEVANTIVFLLGDESSFTTGQALCVSGGYP